MKTLIEDAVCGTHSMRKAFAVVSAEIREKLSDLYRVGNDSRRPRAQPLRSSCVVDYSSFAEMYLCNFSSLSSGHSRGSHRRIGVLRLARDNSSKARDISIQ